MMSLLNQYNTGRTLDLNLVLVLEKHALECHLLGFSYFSSLVRFHVQFSCNFYSKMDGWFQIPSEKVLEDFFANFWSYFVVKFLHFLKESKYFSLYLSYTMKPRKSRKRLKKCTLEIEGFQSVINPWNNLQTCHLNT